MGFFDPDWVNMLHEYIRLDKTQIKQLEKLRKDEGISHKEMSILIAGSQASVFMYYQYEVKDVRRENPNASPKEIVRKLCSEFFYGEEALDEGIKNVNTAEDIARLAISQNGLEKEREILNYYDMQSTLLGLGKKVDEILGWHL